MRKENGLEEVAQVFVDIIMVSDEVDDKYSNKMSSSLIRNYIVSQR